MAGPTQEYSQPYGAAFDEFFESIGKKAEQLTVNDQSKKSPRANSDSPAQQSEQGEEDQKVVDEIESLCMNCHENVSCSS
jgi:zinc finger protein